MGLCIGIDCPSLITVQSVLLRRFFVGAKSATAPVYTSETAPAILRGGLVMLWQTFTAFGVMMGTIM